MLVSLKPGDRWIKSVLSRFGHVFGCSQDPPTPKKFLYFFCNTCEMAVYKYQLQRCMKCYHIYQEEWEAAISEELLCEREKKNAKDPAYPT